MIYFLFFLLILGTIFVFTPLPKKNTQFDLKSSEVPFSEISSLILLASPRKKENPKGNVTFEVVQQFVDACSANKLIKIWLISDSDHQDNSSYKNSLDIKKEFERNDISISVEDIKDPKNAKDVFRKTNDIFASEASKIDDSSSISDIFCDCTGGTKPMAIGLTLACLNKGRLVYYVDKKYQEVDTKFLLSSLLKEVS